MFALNQLPTPKPKDLRLFGVLLAAFLVFLSWKFWRFAGVAPRVLWGGAGLVLLLAAVFPRGLFWVHRGMLLAVFPVGWLVVHVFLLLVLCLVMAPIGFVMRLTGSDHLARRWNKNETSYWHEAEHPLMTPEDFSKLY